MQKDPAASPPVIAITAGEPAGIGPDIVLQLTQESLPLRLVVVADADMLSQRAEMLGIKVLQKRVDEEIPLHQQGSLCIHHVPLPRTARCGKPDPENAGSVLKTLEIAAGACLDRIWDALVTGPLQKSPINDAGIQFSGHTEFLAGLAGAETPVMMLVAGELRIALATTHLPLRQVPDEITAERLDAVLGVLWHDLRSKFALRRPRILVCGLNPHAGEGGHLGDEEISVITPAILRAREAGINVVGPLPADSLFTPRNLDEADAVLAMFHDQGLPVLKYAGFGSAVNVTLGLPIVRTSVDHGTALDVAGSGRSDIGSLLAAISLANELAEARAR
jgi:4-hydroxythreonine-4-phosphate dehydrogenase